MSLIDDIAKIPRRNTHGLSKYKSITSVYVNPDKMDEVKSIAKEHHVSISGILVFALDRLLSDIETAKTSAGD
jgi:hypothetical protein